MNESPQKKPNWLIRVLNEHQLRMWHLMVAFIVSSGVGYFLNEHGRYQQITYQRSQELVEVSADFENRVNAMVHSSETFENISSVEIGLLLANVEQQIRSLNSLKPVLDGDKKKQLIDDYTIALIDVRNILQDGFEYDETRAFGERAIALVEARDTLLEGL